MRIYSSGVRKIVNAQLSTNNTKANKDSNNNNGATLNKCFQHNLNAIMYFHSK